MSEHETKFYCHVTESNIILYDTLRSATTVSYTLCLLLIAFLRMLRFNEVFTRRYTHTHSAQQYQSHLIINTPQRRR